MAPNFVDIQVSENSVTYNVYFNYNPVIIEIVKSIPGRTWNPDQKHWTIPARELGRLVARLRDAGYSYNLPVGVDLPVLAGLVEAVEDIDKIPLDSDIADFVFKTEPMKHQRVWLQQARNKLNATPHLDALLLADEQGLGKTKEAYDFALFNGYKRILVISCVASAVWNWMEDAEKHTEFSTTVLGLTPKGKINTSKRVNQLSDFKNLPEVVITNIQFIRTMKVNPKTRKKDYIVPDIIVEAFKSGEIDLIVFDEIHKGVSPTSTQGKIVQKMVKQLRKIPTKNQCKVILLTGTPIVNTALDAYTSLAVGNLVTQSWYQWSQSVCIFGGFNQHDIIGYRDINALKKELNRIMIRREKKLLDLPPKIRTTLYADMSDEQSKLYREVYEEMLELQDLGKTTALTTMLRLRQVIDCPSILDPEFNMRNCSKLQTMLEQCELTLQTEGTKIIIFFQWVEVISEILPYLRELCPDVAVYTGSNKRLGVGDRELEKERFKTDPNCRIIVGISGALGVSHTLTMAQSVIHYELPYTYADFCQDEDRAHRKGTKSTVNSYTILVRDSVDMRVKDLVDGKLQLSDFMLN